MKKVKKTISILLSVLMVFSVFAVVPFTASAATNTAYIYRWWDSESKQVKSETRYAEATKLQDLSADLQDLNSGWYYSQNWIEFNKRVTIHGTVNIIICEEGGSYVKFKDGIHVSPGNTLNIYGQGAETQALEAFADTNDYAGIGGNGNEDSGTINIYGGVVNAKADVDAAGIGGGFKGKGGHINIYGGKIKATGGSEEFDGGAGIGGGGDDGFGGFIKIYGGDVTAVGGANAAGIGGGDNGTSGDIEIFGGTVHAYGGSTAADGGAGIGSGNDKGVNNIVIYNGDVTAHGGGDAAGIGGGDEGNGGKITIAGGTVEATGGQLGAGIGSGQNGFDFEIKITNAQVTATGGINAAGIGGGDGATGGTITITNSRVNATGGSEYSDGGAGIGGGNEGNGGTITITNSEVGAQGGCDAAGIGGGDYGVGGDITITGSVVKGIGGDEGAGIGGGQGKDGGNIKINGTRVAGVGGDYAAGIGGGGYGSVSVGNGGVITITGGEVAAEGGEYGAGIGGGYQGKSGTIKITGGEVTAEGGNGGAGVGSGAACPADEDAVDITIEGGDIKARGGSSTTEVLYGLYIFEGASIGAGGCTHELVLFTDPGDIEAVSYFTGTINLNGGTITANSTIGATEEDDLLDLVQGEVYFNGATVQIETDENNPSVRAKTIIFKDEDGIGQKVSYADSRSGPYTVVPKDVRIDTLQAVKKKYVKVSLCEHENMICTDNPSHGDHRMECPNCEYVADSTHTYGDPVWSWAENHSSATATFTCEKCGHTEIVDSTVTWVIDGDGMTTYTATARINGKTYTATFTATPYVASVTSNGTTTKYTDFGTAVSNWTDGSTLTLLADVTMNSPVNVSGTRTLDLNGYGIKVTVVNTTVFNVSGNLTLNDSDATKIHKFDPPSGTAGLATLNEESGSLEIHGGYITGFKGVTKSYLFNVSSGGSFTINGGNLIGNEGTQKTSYNGTVVISASGDLTINGGAIIYNKSGYWGTAISAACTLKINGGTIAHNYASQSTAGIYCWYLEMTGGSVTDNVAATTGQSAGITVERHATFSGNPVIKDNTDSTGASNLNVYMQTKCSAISSNLGENACIGITMSNPGVFTDSSDTSFNDPTKFFSDKSNYIVGKNAAGQLLLGVPRTVTWKMDDGTIIDTTTVANGTTPTHTAPTKAEDAKNTYTFSGWTPAVAPVTGDVTYTATFTAVPKALFTGHSVTLGGDVGVNFFLNPDVLDTYSGTKTVKFTCDGEETTVAVPETLENDGYKVTCNVVAARMAHKIKAVVYVGGTALDQTDSYSVQDYAEGVCKDSDQPDDLKALAAAMLHYGAEAQTVFDSALHEHPDRADKNVGAADYSGVTVDAVTAKINGTASNLTEVATQLNAKYFTNSLIYMQNNTLRVYFTPEEYGQTMPNANAYTGNQSNYYYYKDKAGIAAAELDDQQEFTVGNVSFKYSPLNYVVNVLNSNMSPAQKDLAKALFLYNQAANAYFDEPAPAQNIVNLSTITEDTVVEDGYTITGTLQGDYKISIAENATVTLKDVDITCLSSNTQYDGIALLGDATILLEGENTVKGGYKYNAGIFVPENKTLTIDGTGSLNVSSGGSVAAIGAKRSGMINGTPGGNIVINGGTINANGGNGGAGIGGCTFANCGTITINGGTVTAVGNDNAPGIGSGNISSFCASITINGGTVTATGNKYAAGIGSGQRGSCGDITIAGTVTQVTATKGELALNSIGAGKNGTCGTISIADPSKVTQN